MKSQPGVPEPSQALVSTTNTDEPASTLRRTAARLLHSAAKPRARSQSPTLVNVDVEGDPLLAFASEDAPGAVVRLPSLPADGRPEVSGVALRTSAAIVVVVGLAVFGALYIVGWVGANGVKFGTLAVETEPPGADVIVDGQRHGFTPLEMSLPPGAHTVVVRHGAEERRLPLMLAAGAEVVHHVEFSTVKPTPLVGGISVVTDPPGARVLIDGDVRGESPITLNDLQAADYKVSVTSEAGAANRTVAVRSGETVSVVFSLPRAPRPAGKQTSAIVSQALGYQDIPTVDVAGKIAKIQVDAPNAAVNVNARPWADVFIDGENVGQTPIGNLSLPIGTHEVVFRHPELGERRQTVTVTATGPNRVVVDLTK
jgi:hypothetical protein